MRGVPLYGIPYIDFADGIRVQLPDIRGGRLLCRREVLDQRVHVLNRDCSFGGSDGKVWVVTFKRMMGAAVYDDARNEYARDVVANELRRIVKSVGFSCPGGNSACEGASRLGAEGTCFGLVTKLLESLREGRLQFSNESVLTDVAEIHHCMDDSVEVRVCRDAIVHNTIWDVCWLFRRCASLAHSMSGLHLGMRTLPCGVVLTFNNPIPPFDTLLYDGTEWGSSPVGRLQEAENVFRLLVKHLTPTGCKCGEPRK